MPELDRRDFLKIVGMTAGAAATAACKDPLEKVIPYLNQPEEIVPGIAVNYFSTCRECPEACAIVVRTREGRPIKVDGHPEDPMNRGSLCVRGQSSLARTYDAARFRQPQKREADGSLTPITWDEGIALLVEKLGAAASKSVFIGGSETGTLDGVIDAFLASAGSSNRLRFESYAWEALRTANEKVFGTSAVPQFKLDAADVVVAFGTDFIETFLGSNSNQVGYGASRRGGHGYAAFVGPRLGLSGGNTDLWLAPEPGTEILVALALANAVAAEKGGAPEAIAGVLARFSPAAVAAQTGVEAEKVQALAHKIAKARAPLALPPGVEVQGTNAAAFNAAVQMLNVVSGAVNKTVVFGPDHNVRKLARFEDLKALAGQMRGGEVPVLMVHQSNPVYAAPQVAFAEAAQQGDVFVVSFSSANDETTALAGLILPDSTPYESWGDAEPVAGLRRLQQPTVRAILDTRQIGDVLIETGRALGGDLGVGSFKDQIAAAWGADFPNALGRGGSFETAPPRTIAVAPNLSGLDFVPAQIEGSGDFTLVVYPSLHFYDGRSQRIAMLNEIPDPVTKTMWGSYAEMHDTTAESLGVVIGNTLRVKTDEGGTLELPVYPHKGVRPGVVAIQVGQGHIPVDPEHPDPMRDWREQRRTIGVNAFQLIPGKLDSQSGALAWLSTKATVEATGERSLVSRAQLTFNQERRGFGKATTLVALASDEHNGGGHTAAPPSEAVAPIQGDAEHLVRKKYDPGADSDQGQPYRWGMSIDLDQCAGCNACIAACAAENNTPVIGEQNTRIGREMHWIRIERYVESTEASVDVRHVPMMCQHCGAAPCESVCPAIATYHNPEGLNVMVPNRCIGTRFCSNNCPYKARRFNHWPYDFGYRDPEHLGLNPDVTVRSKGVMEKCTMCVHRINDAKNHFATRGTDVPDGVIQMACQQACPSNAITFGNLREKDAGVTKERADKRSYAILDHLYTRPGVSYMKKIIRTEDHA